MPWNTSSVVNLTANDSLLAASSSTAPLVVAAGARVPIFSGTVATSSLVLFADALTTASPPVTPFFQFSLNWNESATFADDVGIEHWICLTTNVSPANSNSLLAGRAPTRASNLTVFFKNFDTSPVTVDYGIWEASRDVARSDLRQVSNNILNSYTYGGLTFSTPVSEPTGLILGNSPAIALNAGQTQTRINALFCGQAQLFVNAVGTSPDLQVTVYTVDPNLATPLVQMYGATLTGTPLSTNLTLPREPSVIEFANNGANPVTVVYSLIGQEFAS